MKILICSSNLEFFNPLLEYSGWELVIQEDLPEGKDSFDIAYLDQILLDCRKEDRDILQKLKTLLPIPWGILDTQRKLKDPMELVLHGWSDIISGKDLLKRFTPQRVEDILYYDVNRRPVPQKITSFIDGNPSGDDWTRVQEGQEYIFGMLYLEAVPPGHLESQLGEQEISRLQGEWRNLMMEFFDPWYGYLWINNGWSSVMLFPFNGQSFHAIEGTLEFLLNQPTFRFPSYQGKLLYRQVLHLASAPFHKRNQTSNVISESLNDLFHMGLYFAEEGRLYITEEVKQFLPESLTPFVLEPSLFEGHRIYPFRKCR